MIITFTLQRSEREIMRKASIEGQNLAGSLAEHMASSVRAIDLSLKVLSDAWARDPASFADSVARHQEFLKDESVTSVLVSEAGGRIVWASAPGWQGLDLSDRQYFKIHKAHSAQELYISEPVLGRLSKEWTIAFTRPIFDRQQRFAGVVVLSVPPPALQRIYNNIDLGDGATITFVRADGQILARSHDLARSTAISLATAPGLGSDDPPAGEFRRQARIDGMERLYRYQRVPGYPLTMFVGQSVNTILASYQKQRTIYLFSGTLATATLLAIMLLLIARWRNEEAADQDRARLEANLRQSERRFRLIAESIDEVVWSADTAIETNLYISPAYERVWGRSRASLQANPRSFIDAIYPEDRERVLANLEVVKMGVPFDHEYRIVLPDGSVRWIWDRGFPVRNETGQVVRYVGAAQDITERKHAEDNIRNLNEDLERRVRERTEELHVAIEALRTEVQERRLAETSALSLSQRVQTMARRLGEAQEAERRRLAAELHDGVCSNLAAIGLNLALLQMQLPHSDTASMQRRLSALVTLIDEAKANAKDISLDLRPLLLDNSDLRSALEEYGRKFESSTGIAVELRGADSGRRLPAEDKIALFRITQEALTNCAKHARANAVAIELNTDADHLVLSIADNGIGIALTNDDADTKRLGLLSMQERAEAIGARWQIESAPGKGTRVIVSVGVN
ncbi:MAG: PAS domain-containing protein [Pseudomonadota bacterium]